MHPEWLAAFEMRFRGELEPVVDRIRRRFPTVDLHLSANSWGQATEAAGYIVYLSCKLPNVGAHAPDNLDLEISLYGIGIAPHAIADVCWGHPSGYIEAEWINHDIPFTEVAQESFFLALPKLVSALESGLKRGKPPDADA